MILCAITFVVAVLATSSTFARTPDARERGLLDFIGSIESFGYDDYYNGVSASPPRRLTTMTVEEVLAWQDSVDATSRSEAAGRYHIMEDTLRGLVRDGVVSPDAVFNATTQDSLALHLLERRGWDPSRTDYVSMGNSIAYEWAALPLCSGFRAGRSAYDGLAGNTARTSCETWLAVLEGSADPAIVTAALARSVVGGGAFGGTNALEAFIGDFKETFYDLSDTLVPIATSLLLSLLVIEWVWSTAQQVVRGAGIGGYLSTLMQRVVLAAIFLFIIRLGDFSDLIIRSADALLMQGSGGASINIVDIFDRLLITAFELFGRTWFSVGEKIAAFVILVLGAMIIALIVLAYIEVYLAFAAAIVALGFAGWSGTRHIATRYLKRVAGRVLSLFTALFCGALVSQLLTFDLTETEGDAFLLVGFMIVLAMAMLSVPSAVERAVFGFSGQMAGVSAARGIGATPGRWLMKKVGL